MLICASTCARARLLPASQGFVKLVLLSHMRPYQHQSYTKICASPPQLGQLWDRPLTRHVHVGAYDEQYGAISPIPDHDGTECLKWDDSLWSHAEHFKVRVGGPC